MRPPKTLNPLLNEDETVDSILRLLFEPMVVLDEQYKPELNLLNNIALDTAANKLNISLKDNLYWSDGSKIDSYDIAFSIDTIKQSSRSIYKDTIKDIVRYNIIDELSMEITYSGGYINTLSMLCFPLIPRIYYAGESDPAGEKNMTPNVVNGPYTFSSYAISNDMYLKLNDRYFKNSTYIDSIRVVITNDKETDLDAFSSSIVSLVRCDINDLGKYSFNNDINISDISTQHYELIGFNFSNQDLNRKEIRQLINRILPKDIVLKDIYLNQLNSSDTAINPNSFLFTEVTDIQDTEELPQPLDENISLNLLVNENNEYRIKLANLLKELCADYNIIINIDSEPFDDYKNRIESGEYYMFISAYYISPNGDLYDLLHSAGAGDTNVFNYSDNSIDFYLNSCLLAETEEELVRNMKEVQNIIYKDIVFIGLGFKREVIAANNYIYGNKRFLYDNIFYDINQWFINK